MALTPAQAHVLQELFILATGSAANTPNYAALEALLGPNGDFSKLVPLINGYMDSQVKGSSELNVFRAVARQGLGLELTEAQATQTMQTLKAMGLDTWAKLFQWIITNNSAGTAALDNRADAALHFSDLLKAAGKTALFEGKVVSQAVGNLLQGIGKSTQGLDAAKHDMAGLAENLTADGITSAVMDGYVAGASVFADANENGKLDWLDLNNDGKWQPGEGEWSGVTNASGNYVLPRTAPLGTITASGGIDIMTNKPFQGVLTAPAGSTVVNPLTTLMQTMIDTGQVKDAEAAKVAIIAALDLPE